MSTTTVEVGATPAGAPPSRVDDEVRDALRKAKGFVAKDWAQGTKVDMLCAGRYCALTAIRAACPTNVVLWLRATRALADALGFERELRVVTWNDAPGRTQAEVIDLFDRALGA